MSTTNNNELSFLRRQRLAPSSNGSSHPLRRNALQNRLEHIVLLELTQNGEREYHTKTLRGLYDYVIKAITSNLKSSQPSDRDITGANNGDSPPINSINDTMTGVGVGSTPLLPSLAEEEEGYVPEIARTLPTGATAIYNTAIPVVRPTFPISKQQSLHSVHSRSSRHVSTNPQQQQQQQQQQSAEQALHHDYNNITYRERLGGYLHPRDMRKLVTPFSSSNEPELMVRRHVMLLNFDPLRAIVLRDRLLLLVPDGADSILISLERRVLGGTDELAKQFFGDDDNDNSDNKRRSNSNSRNSYTSSSSSALQQQKKHARLSENVVDDVASAVEYAVAGLDDLERHTFGSDKDESSKQSNVDDDNLSEGGDNDDNENDGDLSTSSMESVMNDDYDMDNEWDDIEGMNWIELPFELQSVDAVLASVVKMLIDDTSNLRDRILTVMEQLRSSSTSGDHTQEGLRLLKDEVKEMEARVQGFVRAMNQILDDEEDMALMNLSRIISNPERFIQPVPQEVLNEESDEPELILEAYLQQSLSEVNALELLKGKILNTEALVSLQLDTTRNRLLYINTVVSAVSVVVATASLVGSIFGMNLINHLEDDEHAFLKVLIGTIVGMIGLFTAFIFLISGSGLIRLPKNQRKL